MLIGGNYTESIKEHLAYQPGEDKAILDLGCGTGAWYARRPYSSRTGEFECDANKGLGYENAQFNLVNSRMIAMGKLLQLVFWSCIYVKLGIKNYPSFIGEISRVLKPNGFLQLQEWDFFVVDSEKNMVGVESWFGRWCAALRHGLAVRGASINAAQGLDGMISAQGTFASVNQQNVWMPIGPCFPKDTADGMRLNLVGEFMRENVKAFIKGGRTLILGTGMNVEEYDTLAFQATKEVQDVTRPMYLRLNCVTARKQ
ncbi:hypothetical protein H0H81_007970 [Sphagnurus paluster]|uniref:S-adenosyl-L-methionine-dependent methyltransferase n=1 Tax=Sphagnurus paluster TaxID=117069 RepID=A0A9P7K4E2_9AGAR|nr:hypothetical protein H0H81_007970 [Sphagnurus paluster]